MPPFILLDERDNPDRCFVMHTTAPRFLMEFVPGGEGEFILIDHGYTTAEIATAKAGAREFFGGDGALAPAQSNSMSS
jgi:hypothetical protein